MDWHFLSWIAQINLSLPLLYTFQCSPPRLWLQFWLIHLFFTFIFTFSNYGVTKWFYLSMIFDFQVRLWWPTIGYAPNVLKSQGWIKISSVNELSPVLIRLLPQILVSGHWRRMLVSCGTGKGLGMRFSWDNYEHGGHIHNIMFTFLDLLQLAPVHTVHRQQHCSIRRTINTKLRRVKATLSRRWLKFFSCPYYLDNRI